MMRHLSSGRFLQPLRPFVAFFTLAALFAAGCAGSGNTSNDGGLNCDASKESGVYLLNFGPFLHDVLTGGQATLSVIVVRGSEVQGEGRPENGYPVSFRVTSTGATTVTLDRQQVSTNVDGLANVTVSVADGTPAGIYMVEASAQGTCPLYFTVDVTKPIRQLRAISPDPFDTFTATRVPITVEATTNSSARLSGEEITFSLGQGQLPGMLFTDMAGGNAGKTIKLVTDGAGRATAMLGTGTVAAPQVIVIAKMKGTADATVKVRIQEGSSTSCADSSQCPLGYSCNTSVGMCEPPPPTPPPTGCKGDTDCQSPTICNVSTGQCLEPTGGTCDPIEGTGCKADEVCVGSICAKLPSGCQTNNQCPASFVCTGGSCKPNGAPPAGGCVRPKDCPANQTCINGQCKPKAACNIQHQPDRMAGNWQYDSTLNLREGLSGFMKGILSVSGDLRDIIEGRFTLKGIPSIVSDLVSRYLRQLIDQYVPAWGQQMVIALGNVNDIIDTMRIVSSVRVASVGKDAYVHSEQWDLIEFEYKGQQISSAPHAIPEIGQIKINNYTASEVCGVYFINKHAVKNVIGGLIKWVIQTALSVVTCSSNGVPCYNTLEQSLQGIIDCPMLAMQLDMMLNSIWSGAPSVANIIAPACEAAKTTLIRDLNDELDGLTTKLTFFELSGTVDIPNPGQDHTLDKGKWNGSLGYSVLKGDFNGTFKAYR
jgi:hypothetical protein